MIAPTVIPKPYETPAQERVLAVTVLRCEGYEPECIITQLW